MHNESRHCCFHHPEILCMHRYDAEAATTLAMLHDTLSGLMLSLKAACVLPSDAPLQPGMLCMLESSSIRSMKPLQTLRIADSPMRPEEVGARELARRQLTGAAGTQAAQACTGVQACTNLHMYTSWQH
jgi:hypothetical protein